MGRSVQDILDRQGFLVLDGGLATALESAGHVLDTPLWSAGVLLEAPEAVRSAHAAFLEAGADCISTASYQASLPGFARVGVGPDEGARLLRLSVGLAAEASAAFWADPKNRRSRCRPLVAASVGPYGAFLADGSEYDGRYGVGPDALAAFHRPRLEILVDTAADLLAVETIPSLQEAEVLVALLSALDHPGAWISFTCRDDETLWDGTAVEDAARACSGEAGVVAVGVNCTEPAHVAGLLRRIRKVTDLPLLAYPNSGEAYDAGTRAWITREPASAWLDRVPGWTDAGASLIGGCCRVGPDLIRGIRRHLESTTKAKREGERAV